ncbi:DUF6883 domain-containing protein [Leptolyngbyaceae cyanobacterium UHCC 1019]
MRHNNLVAANQKILAWIQRIVQSPEARLGRQDEFGQRYTLDFALEWQNKNATVRSGWIVEHGSEIPKLTTCYPL